MSGEAKAEDMGIGSLDAAVYYLHRMRTGSDQLGRVLVGNAPPVEFNRERAGYDRGVECVNV